jgi:hypothetical protein
VFNVILIFALKVVVYQTNAPIVLINILTLSILQIKLGYYRIYVFLVIYKIVLIAFGKIFVIFVIRLK